MLQLMPNENDEEDGNADVGNAGAVPVDFRSQEGGVVLASRNDDAKNEGQNRAKGEEGGFIGKLAQTPPLGVEGLAETVMANGDTDPSNEAGHAADVDQPVIGRAFTDEGGQEGSEAEDDRSEQGICRNAAFVQLEEAFRSLTGFSHSVEHTRRYVETGVAGGKNGSQDNSVHEGCCGDEAEPFKDEGKRTDGNIFDFRIQQVRIGVGN